MDVTMRFRATSEEKEVLQAGAKRAGLDFSEWARGVLLSAAGDISHVEGSPEPETVQRQVEKAIVTKQGTRVSKLQPSSGGLKRTQEIPIPDWKKNLVPQRTRFTPVPKGKK